jgi:hypothetical protein
MAANDILVSFLEVFSSKMSTWTEKSGRLHYLDLQRDPEHANIRAVASANPTGDLRFGTTGSFNFPSSEDPQLDLLDSVWLEMRFPNGICNEFVGGSRPVHLIEKADLILIGGNVVSRITWEDIDLYTRTHYTTDQLTVLNGLSQPTPTPGTSQTVYISLPIGLPIGFPLASLRKPQLKLDIKLREQPGTIPPELSPICKVWFFGRVTTPGTSAELREKNWMLPYETFHSQVSQILLTASPATFRVLLEESNSFQQVYFRIRQPGNPFVFMNDPQESITKLLTAGIELGTNRLTVDLPQEILRVESFLGRCGRIPTKEEGIFMIPLSVFPQRRNGNEYAIGFQSALHPKVQLILNYNSITIPPGYEDPYEVLVQTSRVYFMKIEHGEITSLNVSRT